MRQLRISRNINIAGVVVGSILTPLLIWYQINRYQQAQAEMEAYHYY